MISSSGVYDLLSYKDFEIIDAHYHPLDVMGVVEYDSYKSTDKELLLDGKTKLLSNNQLRRGNITQKLNYNRISKGLTKMIFRYYPRLVNSSIYSYYRVVGYERIKSELEASLIDKVVLLPIEPWSTVEQIYSTSSGPKAILFGSIDLHKLTIDEIEPELKKQIISYGVKGLKLHPNLQGFFPEPILNKSELLQHKLRALYKLLEYFSLPAVFHSGLTYYTPYEGSNLEKVEAANRRGWGYGLMCNFFSKIGKSELFEDFDFPKIISHLGVYNEHSLDVEMVRMISKSYSNVYYDSAGVPSHWIPQVIDIAGSDRVIFGSDGMYYGQYYSVISAIKAIYNKHFKESHDSVLQNFFSKNITRLLD